MAQAQSSDQEFSQQPSKNRLGGKKRNQISLDHYYMLTNQNEIVVQPKTRSARRGPQPPGMERLVDPPKNFTFTEIDENENASNNNCCPDQQSYFATNSNRDDEFVGDDGHGDEIATKIWDSAYQMLLSQKHCDVVIITQKGTIKAHRCILAFHSSYLCEVFCQRGIDKKVIIRLDAIPVDTVRQMLCFFYSGDLKVTKFNLVDLLNISEQYCFPILQSACLDFFKDISPENVIFLLSLTNSMGLEPMQRNIMCFIVQYFNQVAQTPDFVYLPFQLLREILIDDDLQVSSELDAFYAVVRWIEYKKEHRLCYAADLLNGPVRLELLSVEELSDEVESQDWLFVMQEAKDVLSEAYRKKLLMESGYCPPCCSRPRNNSSRCNNGI